MFPVEVSSVTDRVVKSQGTLVYRVDILPLSLELSEKVNLQGIGEILAHPVYWFYSTANIAQEVDIIAKKLLTDHVLQTYIVSTAHSPAISLSNWRDLSFEWILEKQYLPGVTDNLGKTVEKNLLLLFQGMELSHIQVASGQVYWVPKVNINEKQIINIVEYRLFNPLIHRLSVIPLASALESQTRYIFPLVKTVGENRAEVISLDIADDELIKLSQNRNLALNLEEMKAIRSYYERSSVKSSRKIKRLPEWPTDVELEIFAQTWSEHCKHKIFAADIEYTDLSNPDSPETTKINSLFKTFIVGATKKIQEKRPDLLSVFKDNSGVLKWNDNWAVCFKVETHNSPSALEPYGGALTGIVGVNRDILGTGLGAKPLFNTDIFCFAHPDESHANCSTMLPAESILIGVRKGVEDGGNKSGIPTINGALFFDPRYRAKPLVFCGTGGLLPLEIKGKLGYEKYTQPGDTIVMTGGRVGKDGIHGATFSSEALNEDSPISAVQIGDPITQKRMSDFLMDARDQGLITGITDNGAGGLSSSVGEMAQITGGAVINLEKVPLKYKGLLPYEIVISESQERMTLSTIDFEALSKLAECYDVEVTAIGKFHTEGTFDILYNGSLLASLDLDFLHDGLPNLSLKAEWKAPKRDSIRGELAEDLGKILIQLLQSPNICSREAIIRQYDHEVQGRSVIKPLMGKLQTAPCDAAVIQPILGDKEGLVVSNGICPQYSDWDTYHMAACAVDEAVRNAVAVGADPKTIALLDNFCWPDPLLSKRNNDAIYKLAQLVRACQALYDIATYFETPLISGKDSMKNDFDDGELRISIPPTLLISAIGKIPDINRAISMEFKDKSDLIFLLGETSSDMGGSEYHKLMGWESLNFPNVDIYQAKLTYYKLYDCIQKGFIRSCHDISEGGLAVAVAESTLGSSFGVNISLESVISHNPILRLDEVLFSESPSRFIISVSPDKRAEVEKAFKDLPLFCLGDVSERQTLQIGTNNEKPLISLDTEALRQAWQRPPASCYASGMTP